jgi:outer membrane protein insertion porin family
VYVRRINIAGNSRTRDEVIRREMRQLEGGWFSASRISGSRSRIDKLGYFTDVNIETPPVQGTTDQVDVNVTVTERPTGAVLLGAGFGSGEGLILSGSVTQQNIFGSGKHVSVGLNTSKLNTTYALSYTDPYYTVDGVSRGFDIYVRELDASRAGLGNYSTRTAGLGLRLGVPVTDIDTIKNEYCHLSGQSARLSRLREHVRQQDRCAHSERRLGARWPRQSHLSDQGHFTARKR